MKSLEVPLLFSCVIIPHFASAFPLLPLVREKEETNGQNHWWLELSKCGLHFSSSPCGRVRARQPQRQGLRMAPGIGARRVVTSWFVTSIGLGFRQGGGHGLGPGFEKVPGINFARRNWDALGWTRCGFTRIGVQAEKFRVWIIHGSFLYSLDSGILGWKSQMFRIEIARI